MTQALRDITNPGTESCGCCAGIEESTPLALYNRIGLSAIAYRIGEYAQFRASMLAGLSSPSDPGLALLRTRDPDDFALGLIDAVACATDVLTFYQERVANESYLRTATERISLQELGKLVGYRMRPGVAAETVLAFALEPPRLPPVGLVPEPGAFVTGIATALTLPAGLKVQSVPGPDEKPQTFETVEQVDARPEWNTIRPWLSTTAAPGLGATETWFDGVANNLKVGDGLVFVAEDFSSSPGTSSQWDFRLIDSVEIEAANNRTHVRWKDGLQNVAALAAPVKAPEVYVFRRKMAVFGHNAPMWSSLSRQFRHGYPGGVNATDWPDFTISTASGHVDLDSLVSEVRPRGLAVLMRGSNEPAASSSTGLVKSIISSKGPAASIELLQTLFVELYQISSVTEASRAAFALSGKVTRLGLVGQNLASSFSTHVRESSVYVQSERLNLAKRPVEDAVSGDSLPLNVSADGLLPKRKLIVTGQSVDAAMKLVHPATIVAVSADSNGVIATITPPLPVSLERDSVFVHANVTQATHGETVTQVLGAGDASQAFQRFELKRLPLTYRSASNESGAKSELLVRVGDVAWSEQSTLFGAAATEHAFGLNTDEQGKLWLVFGDGIRGARLPSGVNNVRATYRQGLGIEGNVRSDTLTQLVTRPPGLKSVSNPLSAQGGTDPEPADQARRTIPLGTRTLGRAVSLLDYADFALGFAGIAKAQARVVRLKFGPTIAITLAGQSGALLSNSNPVWQNLWLALKTSGDPYVDVTLVAHAPSTFRLGLSVKRDPAYPLDSVLTAVETALRSHFGFDARSLGQPVLESDVIAVAHSVPGVIAVVIDYLYGGTAPWIQTTRTRHTRLLASTMRVSGGAVLPAELLTLSPGPLDRLDEMT